MTKSKSLSADVGANTTTTIITTTLYDYGDYYSMEVPLFAPCDSSGVRAFGKWFLPFLYSLVFILGIIGMCVCV